jgi:class 3 adenylate cyclase/predicted ATPase
LGRPVEQIADWLEKLGLGQYAKLFADNDIDVSVLPHITDQDLKDLGVSLGHRRKIFAAVNKGLASVEPLAEAERAEEPLVQDGPERRYVTVLFSDLVGSTALSTRLDPEDLRDVIAVYQRCVEETVRRFDGFIAKFLGDGVLVYFGYPEAHENDPEQAVRAGLELVAAVRGLQTPEPLEARVGIATGLVVVGDMIGSGASQEQSILGKTPNLAARLQGIAEPSMVVIADSTRKLLGNLFELEDLGGKDLKGIEGPERAWAVFRANPVDSRFDAFHAIGVTELVGRQEELDLLLRRWSKAASGEGQVVLLSGEPGIGKSRLTAALLERLATEPHTRLRYFCSPQHTDSALYPIINQMERAAGFAHNDTAQAKLDKLDTLLASSFTPPQDRALFGDLLSLPNDDRYPKLELTPQQRRQRTFEALTMQIASLAEQRPVLMVFEDVHWIDPTSLEALGRGIDRIKSTGVLLIITHRPEFEPPWLERAYVTSVNLNRLGAREIGAMIDRVAGNHALPDTIRQDIIERTDGIPLFVEEMTKAVLEAETEGEVRKTVAAVPSSVLAVPASLHASLMARLDRLGPAKEVAQIGAVVGREFSHALLAAVALKPEAELQSALDRLVEAALLFRQGVSPHVTYLFKHALVQDAAYGTLLREPRRRLHARIAETLETQFGEITDSQPELLARHCAEAGLTEKAASLWGKAGQRSIKRSALVEAITQLTEALDQLASLQGSTAIRREQIKLQVALASTLYHVKGVSSPDAVRAYDHAIAMMDEVERLGEKPEDPLAYFAAGYGFWVSTHVAADHSTASLRADQFMARAQKQNDTTPFLIGYRIKGISLTMLGQVEAARDELTRAINGYRPEIHRPLAARFAVDFGISALLYRGLAVWLLGYPEAALKDANEGLKGARELGQAGPLMHSLYHSALPPMLCRELPSVEERARELAALAHEKSASFWSAEAELIRGWVLYVTGQASKAKGVLTAVLQERRNSMGANLWNPWYFAIIAHGAAISGDFAEAQRQIASAYTSLEKTNERWAEAEIRRLAGEIHCLSQPHELENAEDEFARSLAIARQQKAKSWELRAAMSLARLWRDQGKVSEARELLAPVYGWFTEGFDTCDLKEAKALLAQLGA